MTDLKRPECSLLDESDDCGGDSIQNKEVSYD